MKVIVIERHLNCSGCFWNVDLNDEDVFKNISKHCDESIFFVEEFLSPLDNDTSGFDDVTHESCFQCGIL